MLDWDDLRHFLVIARAGSLIAAAQQLTVNHTTVSRRMSSLEAALGARLFDRSPRGTTLTPAGVDLLRHAERIEAEVAAASNDLAGRDMRVSGVVRLSTPEAFGTFLVAPNAARLHRLHPQLELELAPESRAVSLSRREADIAIALRRPPRGRVAARRLVDYRLGLYAARDYLDRQPPIDTLDTIRRHPLVWYIDELIDLPELRFLDQFAANARTVFRSSSIAAQHAAVAGGLGLGMLHVFAAQQDERLVRLLPDQVEVIRSYWMLVHADLQRLPRVRAVIAFLEDLIAANIAQF